MRTRCCAASHSHPLTPLVVATPSPRPLSSSTPCHLLSPPPTPSSLHPPPTPPLPPRAAADGERASPHLSVLDRYMHQLQMRQPVKCRLLTPSPLVAVVGMPMELHVRVVNPDLDFLVRPPEVDDFALYVRSGPAKSKDYRLVVEQISDRDFR